MAMPSARRGIRFGQTGTDPMNLKSSRAPGSPQREAILMAATATFLRYGFKKTSMDDVAQAAGVSRQGVYLYFETKDVLFRQTLQHLMSRLVSNARAAAEDGNLSFRDRLLGAFEAVHCSAFHNASREDALELLQSSQSAAGALLVQSERDLMGIAAALLTEAGVADRWKKAGVTVAELAEQLLMSAKGIKTSVDTLAAYRKRMRTAIRIVTRSP
jgi:AcrR family transcriptional regulator